MQNKHKKRSHQNLEDFEVFPWNKNFETGLEKIDSQHRFLVDLLNSLARTLINDDVAVVNKAFNEIAEYADYHFEDEEKIWKEYLHDDDWFKSHQMSHKDFLPKVIELKENNPDRALTHVIEDITKFLIRWLAFHILDADKRMSIVVSEIKSGASISEAKSNTKKRMSGSMSLLIETILIMYDGLSSSAIELMRERHARNEIEEKLIAANKKLSALSITDELTSLYNRRHFIIVFNQELKRARREKKTLTYIQIDVDSFKAFNDNFGHLEGDNALQKIGEVFLKICRRPDDFAFRIGGEEFGIIAANLSESQALNFSENIRKSVEGLKIPHPYSGVHEFLTISMGTLTRVPNLEDEIENFIKTADDNLYKAKKAGKNRIFTESSPER